MNETQVMYYSNKNFLADDDCPCNGVENISLIVQNAKRYYPKKRKLYKIYKFYSKIFTVYPESTLNINKEKSNTSRHFSVPNLRDNVQSQKTDVLLKRTSQQFFVNCVPECMDLECIRPFLNPFIQTKWKIYRCQLNTQEESCCCSCNSDAMFEVMKSLYDCYKKKNCDHCNCILCGHLPREERRLGEIRKSISKIGMGVETTSAKERKEKSKSAEKILVDKTKSIAEKEKTLEKLILEGVPLPEGKTASQKALVRKVKAKLGVVSTKASSVKAVSSEKLRKAKAAGLLTPLEGKTPEQKEKILKGLISAGIPLPEGKTASDKKLIHKVRTEMGLPPEPKTSAEKEKYKKAMAAGMITPLEGKSAAQKEKILKSQAEMGISLPEGRTPSEKALIAKIKASVRPPSEGIGKEETMAEKMKKAKATGLLTSLTGKTPDEREKIVKGLALQGLPLPEGKTASEKHLIEKVRAELGLPPEPKTNAEKEKYKMAQDQGLIVPLEGKSQAQKEKNLQGLYDFGIPLPDGRTPSEKALIAKLKGVSPKIVPMSEKIRKAKAAGVLTPLEGKTSEQKEKVLRGMALHGIPLPEGKTASDKKLIDKVRTDLGLPHEGKSASDREKFKKAFEAGIITPLEGKSAAHMEKILKAQAEMGLTLPEGRTPSEKALIDKIKAEVSIAARKRSKSRATMVFMGGRSPLPPEKAKLLDEKTARVIKEGKGPVDECICDILTSEKERKTSGRRLPSGKIPSRITSEKLKAAKAAGLLTPLQGKTSEQKEKILRGLAKSGLPLPEAKTTSEKKLIDKVRTELGLPPEPKSQAQKEKYSKALAAGFITPLEGKTLAQKEKILKSQAKMGIPLPEGRTPSEKELIKKVKADIGTPSISPSVTGITSETLRKAKAAGLLTPLEGKTPGEKEKVLKARIAAGLPLPEGKTASDKELIKKVKAATGYLSPEGKTPSQKARIHRARRETGRIPTLAGKTPSQKVKILKSMAKQGIPLPEGATTSEKALIDQVREDTKSAKIPSAKIRAAKAAGLITPLEGKSPAQKEQILRGLAKAGMPLPEGKTASDINLIQKVRKDMGLPPEPISSSLKEKYRSAEAAGIITPLEGKTPSQKEAILKTMKKAGIELPEGRTPSEKSLIRKIKAAAAVPSEKLRAAKAAGLLTPLEGKTPEHKEQILKGLAKAGIPLPEGKSASEKNLIHKVRKDIGLPPEPKTPSLREKYKNAQAAGIITPLEGKTASQKEAALKRMIQAGVELPEGRTTSEKSLIRKVKAGLPSGKLRTAKAAGVLTPLEGKTAAQKEAILRRMKQAGMKLPVGKTPSEKLMIKRIEDEPSTRPLGPPALLPEDRRKLDETTLKNIKEGKGPVDECICGLLAPESERLSVRSRLSRKTKAVMGKLSELAGKTPKEKENTLRGMAMKGMGLPEGGTASEKKLIDKVRTEMGLPPEPRTASQKKKYDKALSEGLIVPLEGKSHAEKERILRSQAEAGLPLPEGRSSSEKALIAKVKAETKARLSVPSAVTKIPSEKLRKAKAAGLLTPLEGKTKAEKEKILRGLAEAGLPLPDGNTASNKSLVNKIKTEYGVPPVGKTASEKAIIKKAKAEGLFTPLAEKSRAEKEKILKGLAEAGLPMPEGHTASEKSLVRKVRTAAGLPAKSTPSERRRSIKTKSKKIGVGLGRLSARSVQGRYPPPPGVTEELEEINKTNTCDRGCGCDRKKIRFKHSYVKIKVTSPDISSLCPCPEECIPGVKGGIFTDNEGIKVTIGSAVGVPSFYIERPANFDIPEYNCIRTVSQKKNINNTRSCVTLPARVDSDLINRKLMQELELITNNSSLKQKISRRSFQTNHNTHSVCNIAIPVPSISDYYSPPMFDDWESSSSRGISPRSSFESIYLIKTDSTLSISTISYEENSSATVSIISLVDSSFSCHSSHYLCYSKSEESSDASAEKIENFTKEINYSTVETFESRSTPQEKSILPPSEQIVNEKRMVASRNEVIVFRMSESNIKNDKNNTYQYNNNPSDYSVEDMSDDCDPIFVINDLSGAYDIMGMINQILSQKIIEDTSSIYVVVPTSDDGDTDTSYKGFSSTTCINVSSVFTKIRKFANRNQNNAALYLHRNTSRGLKLHTKGKAQLHGQTIITSNAKEHDLGGEAKTYASGTLIGKDNNGSIQNIESKLQPRKTKVESYDDHKNKECSSSERIDYTKLRTKSLCDVNDLFTYNNQTRQTKDSRPASSTLCNENIITKEYIRHRTKCRNIYCQTNLKVKPQSGIVSGFGVDTIQDRPCCCTPNVSSTPNHTLDHCVASVVSEFISPMIDKEEIAQGLIPGKLKLNNIAPRSTSSIPLDPTPIRICCIPPCSGYKNCHDVKNPTQWAPLKPTEEKYLQVQPKIADQPCNCSPEKLMGPLMSAKDRKTIGVGGPNETIEKIEFAETNTIGKKKVKMSEVTSGSPGSGGQQKSARAIITPTVKTNNTECDRCGVPLRKSGKKGKYKPCPCEQHAPPELLPSVDEINNSCRSTGGQCQLNADAETGIDNKKLKKSKWKKNKVEPCPCKKEKPEMTTDDEDPYILIDETQMRKLKSDLTHMTSGFKMRQKKRPPKPPPPPPPEPELLMTLHEAMMYLEAYASLSESADETSDELHVEGKKKKKKKRKNVECDCPEQSEPILEPEPEAKEEPEEELKGFKFTIGAKGSASKGLSGVCCFDLIQTSNYLIEVSSTSQTAL